MIKRVLSSVLIAVLITVLVFGSSYYSSASNISSMLTDSTTRWSVGLPNGVHMGTKNTTYRYASESVRSSYASIVQSGINLWLGYVNCYENSSGAGLITTDYANGNAVAAITSYTSSNYHITSWEMTIYTSYFNTQPNKPAIIAHELGHAYGLGHVNFDSQIMNLGHNSSMTVTSYDRRGMLVMNDSHSHEIAHSIRYDQNGATHKIRCTSCFSYILGTCPKTTTQSGDVVYIEYNCSLCGNYRTEIIQLQ